MIELTEEDIFAEQMGNHEGFGYQVAIFFDTIKEAKEVKSKILKALRLLDGVEKLDLSDLIKELLNIKPQDVTTSDYILIDSVMDGLFELQNLLEQSEKK